MVKGFVFFGHPDDMEYKYFKIVLNHGLLKFGKQFQIEISQRPNDMPAGIVQDKHLILTVFECQGQHSYMHHLLGGYAEWFQQYVAGSYCSYKQSE